MLYLFRDSKKDHYKAHIIAGADTCCKLWSTGGIKSKSKYHIYPSVTGRDICNLCLTSYRSRNTNYVDYTAFPAIKSDRQRSVPEKAKHDAVKLCIRYFGLKEDATYRVIRKAVRNAAKAAKKSYSHPLGIIVGFARERHLESTYRHMDELEDKTINPVQPLKKSKHKKKKVKQKKVSYPESFYTSREWRELRFKVLEKYGAICMLCNATRKDGVKIHVDHIKPRSKYPELELCFDNLQVLCEDCNLGKSNKSEVDYRPD